MADVLTAARASGATSKQVASLGSLNVEVKMDPAGFEPRVFLENEILEVHWVLPGHSTVLTIDANGTIQLTQSTHQGREQWGYIDTPFRIGEALEFTGLHALGYWGSQPVELRDFILTKRPSLDYIHSRDSHYIFGALYGQVRYRSLSVLTEVYRVDVESFLRVIEEVQTDPVAVMTLANKYQKLIPPAFFDFTPDRDPDGKPREGKYKEALQALIRAGFNPPVWEMESRLKYIKGLLPGPLDQTTAWDHIETE